MKVQSRLSGILACILLYGAANVDAGKKKGKTGRSRSGRKGKVTRSRMNSKRLGRSHFVVPGEPYTCKNTNIGRYELAFVLSMYTTNLSRLSCYSPTKQ